MTPERPKSPTRGPARDPLADFVAANRDRFDDERPAGGTWDAICERLDAVDAPTEVPDRGRGDHSTDRPPEPAASRVPRGRHLRRGGGLRRFAPYWRQAAAAAALLMVGLTGGLFLGGEGVAPAGPVAEVATGVEGPGDPNVAARVDELERAYQRAIDSRLAQVDAFGPEPELRRELVSLSRPEFSASAELADAPPGSERAVVEAMVQEYQAKLDALEHVLERLEAAELAKLEESGEEPNRRPVERL